MNKAPAERASDQLRSEKAPLPALSSQPPELLIEDYPPRLQEILLRALAKKPADRWQTAREFELALEDFAKGERFSCSNYDVEACLKGLFPDGVRPGTLRRSISGTERTEVSVEIPVPGRVATPYAGDDLAPQRAPGMAKKEPMKKADERGRVVTGVHEGPHAGIGGLADPGGGLDEMEREERRQRRRGGGGMMAFIGILVVATAGGLFFLRGYFMGMGHSGAGAAPADLAQIQAADLASAQAAPAVDLASAVKVPEKLPEKLPMEQPEKPKEEPKAVKAPVRPKAPVREKEKTPEQPPRALPRIDPDPE